MNVNKKAIYSKYEVIRKESNGEIKTIKRVKTSDDINDITNRHTQLKAKINDVNKLHSNYNNMITFTTGANKKEYAIIKDYIKDTLIINRLTGDVLTLDSIDLSIYDYLKDYQSNNIYCYNNDNIIVIR